MNVLFETPKQKGPRAALSAARGLSSFRNCVIKRVTGCAKQSAFHVNTFLSLVEAMGIEPMSEKSSA